MKDFKIVNKLGNISSDIDECQTDTHVCNREHSQCINTKGKANINDKNTIFTRNLQVHIDVTVLQVIISIWTLLRVMVCFLNKGSYKKPFIKKFKENQCKLGKHSCSQFEECHNTPESFYCSCITGYTRNESHCHGSLLNYYGKTLSLY